MDTLFPTTIINYIGAFASAFTANNFIYFRGFILGFLLLGETRKCVTNIAGACFFVDRHVSSWERFLSQYQWDINDVRCRLVKLLKERLQGKLLVYGAHLAWVDTTLVAKVKGKMRFTQKVVHLRPVFIVLPETMSTGILVSLILSLYVQ